MQANFVLTCNGYAVISGEFNADTAVKTKDSAADIRRIAKVLNWSSTNPPVEHFPKLADAVIRMIATAAKPEAGKCYEMALVRVGSSFKVHCFIVPQSTFDKIANPAGAIKTLV
jgi:hypothetical protein